MTLSHVVTSARSMRTLAAALAARCEAPLVLRLLGPLGAGKTTFVQGFVDGLRGDGPPIVVQSPTYALMRTYLTSPPVHHLDLYRLHEVSDAHGVVDQLEALGLLDALVGAPSFALVEWPGDVSWPLRTATVRIAPTSARRRVVDVAIPAAALRA
jgi:tRNA threonylcarbamoyladenosine biosynthesis protein TsaE